MDKGYINKAIKEIENYGNPFAKDEELRGVPPKTDKKPYTVKSTFSSQNNLLKYIPFIPILLLQLSGVSVSVLFASFLSKPLAAFFVSAVVLFICLLIYIIIISIIKMRKISKLEKEISEYSMSADKSADDVEKTANKDVLDFIDNFKCGLNPNDTLLKQKSREFAMILCKRFPYAVMMVNNKKCYAVMINGVLYNASGMINSKGYKPKNIAFKRQTTFKPPTRQGGFLHR